MQFNDDATNACTFNDAGSTFVWADLPVSDTFYSFSIGSSTGVTAIRFGTVVGTGDDRQGVNGGSIQLASSSSTWKADFATNLGGNASNAILLYGFNYSGGKGGIKFDDNSKTTVISAAFVNCGEIDPGPTNGGAEMLSFAVIDPEGLTLNYGLKFPQIPVAGTLSHNMKKVSFITSGTPATQYMTHFPYSGDYTVSLDGFKFFGAFTSGTIQHGLNDGTNADITINPSGGTNILDTEFSNTAGGTVAVNAISVPIKVTVKDVSTGLLISDARVQLLLDSDKSVIMSQETGVDGISETTRPYTIDEDILGWVRSFDNVGTDYVQKDFSGKITSAGFSLTVELEPITS